MSAAQRRTEPGRPGSNEVEGPLVWTFDGPLAVCLSDAEDTLRRAIVQLGDVSRIVMLLELSLPALKARVAAGEAIQPAWGEFLARLLERYGLPIAPRVRHLRVAAPLITMVIAYRS
jgi:hypothetical protein